MTTIDARGKSCPMPIVLLAKAVRTVELGTLVKIQADDRAFPEDVEAWCAKTGNQLVALRKGDGQFEAEVRRDR